MLHRKTIFLKEIITLKLEINLLHKNSIEFSTQGRNFDDLYKVFCTLPGCFETASREHLSKGMCVGLILCLCFTYSNLLKVSYWSYADLKVTIIL
jgi:hypothetical protein